MEYYVGLDVSLKQTSTCVVSRIDDSSRKHIRVVSGRGVVSEAVARLLRGNPLRFCQYGEAMSHDIVGDEFQLT